MRARAWPALLVLATAPAVVAGQELGRRVAETADGTVHFSFAVRPGVEICTRGIRVHGDRMQWREGSRWQYEDVCRTGPAQVEVRVADGDVRRVDVLRAGDDGSPGAVDLGEVAPAEAVSFFFDLARRGASSRGARDALFPAVLADVPDVWRDLVAVARERDLPAGVRASALFWLGQEAAEAAMDGLTEVAFAEDEEQEVRDAAVFALSQRPSDEGVPVLMELARTAEQAKTRRTAFFWLAQSKDPRVVPFFEEILLGGRGG